MTKDVGLFLRQHYLSWRSEVRKLFFDIETSIDKTANLLFAVSGASDSLASSVRKLRDVILEIQWSPGLAAIHVISRQINNRLTLLIFDIQVVVSNQYLQKLAGSQFVITNIKDALEKAVPGLQVQMVKPTAYLTSSDVCGSGENEMFLLSDQVGFSLRCDAGDQRVATLLLVYDVSALGDSISLLPWKVIDHCSTDDIDPVLWKEIAEQVPPQTRTISVPLQVQLPDGSVPVFMGESVSSGCSLFANATGRRHPITSPMDSIEPGYDLAVGIFPNFVIAQLRATVSKLTRHGHFEGIEFSLREGSAKFDSAANAIIFRVNIHVYQQGTVDFAVGHVDWTAEARGSMPVRCSLTLDSDGALLNLTSSQDGKIDIDSWNLSPGIANVAAEVADALTDASSSIKDEVNQVDLGLIDEQNVQLQGTTAGLLSMRADRIVLNLNMA